MAQTEAERYLNSLINYEKIPGYDYNLQDFEKFLNNFRSPHKRLKNIIHIAGTKGKGSTAAILNSCLLENGYRVGLYTSPHLRKINERIKLNNQNITTRALNGYIRRIKPFVQSYDSTRTFFEVLTAIAFLYFLENNADFSILEVGLGGRLDATNVVQPTVSVITKIGYDHTDLLGRRLDQIAREKAGILKGGRLVTIHQRPVVEKVILNIARQKKTRIIYAEDLHRIKVKKASITGTEFEIIGVLGQFDTYLPLAGTHQMSNLLIALAVLAELKNLGFHIRKEKIIRGIKKTTLPGRFQVISKRPRIIFDVAHNPDSFEALYHNLVQFRIDNFYLIFGCNQDKKIDFCLRNIFPRAREVYLVKTPSPRTMHPQKLYLRARRYQKNIFVGNSVNSVLKHLVTKVHDKTILITGSFYLWPSDLKDRR